MMILKYFFVFYKNVVCVSCVSMMFVLLSGCGNTSAPKDFPQTFPCKVKVMNGNTPLVGVAVNLFPEQPLSNVIIGGITDSTGIALIQTKYGDYSRIGTPNGEYKIRLTEVIDTGIPSLTSEEEYALTQQQRDARQKEIETKTESLRVIPKILTSSVTTPLKLFVSSTEVELEIDVVKYK
ncbi:MAG: hypothetical protein LBI18_03375 [Planctomycetaceae bacterium]|nr:hypothetical protein [Planctomycetaceae bacterium]